LKSAGPEQTQAEAEFIRETLCVAPPAKLLDVPCGGGRHALALAGMGFDLTGVDISAEFLASAQAATAVAKAEITWCQRAMQDLDWSAVFDGAYCFGNSFGYLDEAGNATFLKAVATALKPGARFVLDTSYVVEVLLPVLQERAWYPTGDILMLAQRRYDPVESRLHVEYTMIRDGQTEKRLMSARIYSFRELWRLVEAAGFTAVAGYGSLAREPFRLGSGRALITATKA
jgi:SAM-dependent methyltransferase